MMAAISRQFQTMVGRRVWIMGMLLACATGLALLWPTATQAIAPTEPAATGPLCRFGVNVGSKSITTVDVASLRMGWYIDYGANASPPRPGGSGYMPIINLGQVGTTGYTSSPAIGPGLDAAIAGNPGAAWIIGNEPDRRLYQNDMLPAAYAHAYHDLYAAIKAKDPTAQVFAGAIVQPTPVRLQYLDEVRLAYSAAYGEAMPVDGWAIHNFILNERSCKVYNDPYICWGADMPPGNDAADGLVIDLDEVATKTGDIEFFKQQIFRFRQWMYDRGYKDTPLYLSEYGILMPERLGFPPATVNKYMTDSFNFLTTQTDAKLGYPADGNRLVQRFSWYSTHDAGFNGSLFEGAAPYLLTSMGQNYRSYTAGIEATPQFALRYLQLAPGAPLIAGGPVTFTLTAHVANAGSNQAPSQATLRFFDGNPAAGGTQIGSDQVVNLSGCGALGTARVTWTNVDPSSSGRPVFAQLIATGVEQTVSQPVFFASEQLMLPAIRRFP